MDHEAAALAILDRCDNASLSAIEIGMLLKKHGISEGRLNTLRKHSPAVRAEYNRVYRVTGGMTAEMFQDEIDREVRRMLGSCRSRKLTFPQYLRRKATSPKSDLPLDVVAMLVHAADVIEEK